MISCVVVNIYYHLKNLRTSDVKFTIENEKFPKKFNKINHVNDATSKESRAPTTRAKGVQLVDQKSDKG